MSYKLYHIFDKKHKQLKSINREIKNIWVESDRLNIEFYDFDTDAEFGDDKVSSIRLESVYKITTKEADKMYSFVTIHFKKSLTGKHNKIIIYTKERDTNMDINALVERCENAEITAFFTKKVKNELVEDKFKVDSIKYDDNKVVFSFKHDAKTNHVTTIEVDNIKRYYSDKLNTYMVFKAGCDYTLLHIIHRQKQGNYDL